MTTRLILPSTCLMLAVLSLTPGCAAASKPRTGRYVVSAIKSPFYKYGPAQAFGPDFSLDRGKFVTVTEHQFGFSLVTTDDGISGYMPNDDLAPAPATPVPAAVRQASRPAGSSIRRGAPEHLEGLNPNFDASEVPLPTDPAKPSSSKHPANSN